MCRLDTLSTQASAAGGRRWPTRGSAAEAAMMLLKRFRLSPSDLGTDLGAILEDDEDSEGEEDGDCGGKGPGAITVDEVPQAFSHFSYEASGGKQLVCDLQVCRQKLHVQRGGIGRCSACLLDWSSLMMANVCCRCVRALRPPKLRCMSRATDCDTDALMGRAPGTTRTVSC